jgi:hypothetical protein
MPPQPTELKYTPYLPGSFDIIVVCDILFELQAWAETPYTYAHWRQYRRLPLSEQLGVLPPFPTSDPRHTVIQELGTEVHEAQQRLDAGDLEDAIHRYWEKIIRPLFHWRLELLCAPPRSPRGRRRESGKLGSDQALTIVMNLIQLCDKKGLQPTQHCVAAWLNMRFEAIDAAGDESDQGLLALLNQRSAKGTDRALRSVERYLQRLCHRLGMTWDEVIRLARTPQ